MGRCYKRGFDLSPFFAWIELISSPNDEVVLQNKGRTETITLGGDGHYVYKALRTGAYTASSEAEAATDTLTVSEKRMFYKIRLTLNTHQYLSQFPHYILGQFTHKELREEYITDLISSNVENIANYNVEEIEPIWVDHILNYGMRKVVNQ